MGSIQFLGENKQIQFSLINNHYNFPYFAAVKVAVVILNWNGKALLEQFLPSVVKFSEEAKIYVADNASTDDSVPFLKKEFAEISIIQNRENGGFAKGYNEALEHIKEDIFILLNSDVEVTPQWIPPILTEFQKSKNIAAIQPKILNYRKKDHFEYAGAAGGYLDKFGYPFCRGRIFNSVEKDEGQYDDVQQIFWASGACFAIRKEDFFSAGGFDEDFFAHQEEIDLCWRLFNRGKLIKYVGASRVYHLGGGTLDHFHPRKTFLNFRNNLYTILKNVPASRLLWLLPARLILDGIAGIKFLFELKPQHTFSIVKAHFSFYLKFGRMVTKRRNIKKKRKYFSINSVIISYYLLGRRKF